jgi:hypothetical protein
MIYVYAIVDDPDVQVTGLCGLSGAPVVLFALGPIAAVGTFHDALELEEEADVLCRHDQVAAALMPRCTVAPTRFGTVVFDGYRLREMLRLQESHLIDMLAGLRGKAELALRASSPPGTMSTPGEEPYPSRLSNHPRVDSDPADAGPGRRYLRQLRAAETDGGIRRLPSALRYLHASLSRMAAASTVTARADTAMTAAYLVGANEVAAMEDTVAAVSRRFPAVDVSLTGPWAPYSFVAAPMWSRQEDRVDD